MTSDLKPVQSHAERDLDNIDSSTNRALIGKSPNHWLYSPNPPTFDLTRPEAPKFPIPGPSACVHAKTTTSDILISPSKTALIIIDMQNFFLSTELGRDPQSAGNKAKHVLLSVTIPAARAAGIRVVWLNWGLSDQDLEGMPPSVRRAFGFEASLNRKAKLQKTKSPAIDAHGVNQAAAEQVLADGKSSANGIDPSQLTENGKPMRLYQGLGSAIGPVKLADGSTVDGGRLLFADTWNADLPPDLRAAYEQGKSAKVPDVWIHKDRMSGLWGAKTACTEFLDKEGLTTLLFAGVNTDQCVGGSLQDAFTKGYDCILVKDACGTTSPKYATESWEFNSARTYGFVLGSEQLLQGVDKMLGAEEEAESITSS